MKSLNDYVKEARARLFAETGTFFAFNQKQFDEQKMEGTEYSSLGSGLIVPKQNAGRLLEELEIIQKKGIEQDLLENGKTAIIRRELFNHECFYTGRIDDCVDALEEYSISPEEIRELYLHILESEEVG